jgi:hypothetical protein
MGQLIARSFAPFSWYSEASGGFSFPIQEYGILLAWGES